MQGSGETLPEAFTADLDRRSIELHMGPAPRSICSYEYRQKNSVKNSIAGAELALDGILFRVALIQFDLAKNSQ